MRWSERQRAMLREMGVPPFWPEERADAVAAFAASNPPIEPAPAHVPQARAEPQAATAPRTTPTASPAAMPSPIGNETGIALGPRPAGIATMDWPELRETVASCQACGLCKSRTQPVFGVGNTRAEWMLIGEAPGEQEDLRGEPFVGRAGQLLDRMLHAVGLTRAEAEAHRQVFIANVLKCRPPANRNPLPQEVAQCEPFLMRQVALVNPKVIVAMGRFAVQSLLKTTDPIGRLRGRVHEVAGVPVIVTYHPAYLLRSPADKALAWDDLCLAREVMARAGPRPA